ncbi:glycoside hydrolase family 3 protein [Paeniglutamicibacter cryotolerans]|uniref:Beta-N-acetylhexosaminidase n=1 Tax=Paeniglutamicibacter cryotolerans TaxID=670079 RepID=A0A839QPY4_9MICC|nr:glycoside hydrolase family 3 protein [Paeniglutamicibacter cryotolerans]MBB2996046.1 beta-N-acetylhexosaminidase [Paeniglutamicibacter cryotolerans]
MSTPTTDPRVLAAGTLMPGFSGTTTPAWVARALAGGLASIALYGTNLESSTQLRELCAELRSLAPDLLLAVDEEGGDVTRLHYLTGSNQPGNALLGRINDPALTEASAAAIGAELAGYGINLNLAPDADVNSTPENPVIGVRSFGADPGLVAAHTSAWIRGIEGAGVASCSKHFPGHGDTATDSHLALPRLDVDAALLHERELAPFRAVVTCNGASIMTSHILVDALDPVNPATFSSAILGDLLRTSMGFTGAVITDALDMAGASADTGIPEAAVRALAAGADLLCLGSETTEETYTHCLDAIVAAVASDRLPIERLQDAARRTAVLAGAFPAGSPQSGGTVPTAEVIATAFELCDTVSGWIADPAPAALIQVDSAANMAVGSVPWGPAATGGGRTEEQLGGGEKVALIGRNLDADHPLWAVRDRLSRAGHRVLVVECGWPRGNADVVTFGASLSVSRALAQLLGSVDVDVAT